MCIVRWCDWSSPTFESLAGKEARTSGDCVCKVHINSLSHISSINLTFLLIQASPKKEICVKIIEKHNEAWVLKHNRIFHDNKQRHIRELCKETKIPMERTVLFDDSRYFRSQVEKIGVLAIPIDPKIGITLKDVRSGIERLRSRQKEQSMMLSYFKKGVSSRKKKSSKQEINNRKRKKRCLDDTRHVICPICNLKFPNDTILEHASSCGLWETI